jgi:hypothetical protein
MRSHPAIHAVSVVACAAASIAGSAACGEEPPLKAQAPMVAPPVGSSSRAITLATTRRETPSELTPVTDDQADPEALRLFRQRMAQAPVALTATATPPRVTAIALDDTRRGEARGMTPASETFVATLKEGERATMPIKLVVGDCAAFIAQGGLGVIEVDLFLTDGDGPTARILAEDTSTGPVAVIGGRYKCVTGAAKGTQAVLNVALRRGGGVVLVREYKK